jgi:hypothetical protein
MTTSLNYPFIASGVAIALHQALRDKLIAKIGIDDVRAAVVGYMAASHLHPTACQFEELVNVTTRKVVEKVG